MLGSSPTASRSGVRFDFESVYRGQLGYVWTNLRRLGVPDASLEDACHDVFVVVHRRRHSFDGSSAMRTWLFGIVRRVAADVRRAHAREDRRRVSLSRDRSPPLNPDAAWLRQVWLLDFLQRLDPDKRDAFVMLELEQMSAREASELTGINPNTLSARLRAAKQALRSALDEEPKVQVQHLVDAHGTVDDPPEDARRRIVAGLLPLVQLPSSSPVPRGAITGSSKAWLVGLGLATMAALSIVVASGRPEARDPPPARERTHAVAGRGAAPTPEPAPVAVSPEPAPRVALDEAVEPGPTDVHPSLASVDVRSKPAAAPKTRTQAAAPASGADDLAAQTQMASAAFAARDPERIVELVTAYERAHPGGFFSDRLAAQRIEALCRQGRLDEANKAIGRLRARAVALAKKADRKCTAITNHGEGGHRDP